MLLKDKVVVISGVGPGMGQSLARLAAAEGAKVVLGARNQAFLDQVAADIKAQGGEAFAVATDIAKTEDCKAIADAAVDAFGRIDGLVNSAYAHGEWATTDVAELDAFADVFNVTCVGALRMAQACLAGMQKAGSGAIVNVSTMSTVNPYPGEAAYSAAKGGLNAMTRHMAKDYGKYGVRVNTTRMGWIGGAPVFGAIEGMAAASGRSKEEVTAEIVDRIPIGVIPPEEDCARGVLFFVSDYSKVVSGAVLDINGGQYMAP